MRSDTPLRLVPDAPIEKAFQRPLTLAYDRDARGGLRGGRGADTDVLEAPRDRTNLRRLYRARD